MACEPEGLYTATEYDLAMMPDEILRQSVEVGRACISREHRGRQVLYLAPLFEIYLRYGGKVCSPPAIDRRFKTIDFLVLLDVAMLSPRARRMFFG